MEPETPPQTAETTALRSPDFEIRTTPLALRETSPLELLAELSEAEAVRQSTATFDVSAAVNEAESVQSQWYPQIKPVASVGLDGEPTFGVNVEQRIYDFGRTRADLSAADTDIRSARVDFWVERNDAIFEAINAYLDVEVTSRRLRELSNLSSELIALRSILEDRATGGAGGRGELIEIGSVQRETEREILDERSRLSNAQTRLRQSIGQQPPSTLMDANISTQDCAIVDVTAPPPELVLARLEIIRSDFALDRVRSRRFPTLVGRLGVDQNGDASGTVSVDASDLLGWDRRSRIDAAQQAVLRAEQNYENTQRNLDLDLNELHLEFERQRSTLPELRRLVQSTEENQRIFMELFDSGQVEVTEGVRLAEEVSRSRREVTDLEVEIVRTCVRRARLNGNLADFSDAQD